MSKRNLNMGTASGKLGDIVYYRRKGQQASRVYRGIVANPQTNLQMDTRVVFRNPQTWYQALKQTPLDLLGLRSKYGNIYSQIMKIGMTKKIPIFKGAAAAGYSLPFPIGAVKLSETQVEYPYIYETKPSSVYQYNMVTGFRVNTSSMPTKISDILTWLQVFNPWLQSGDHIALWAAIQPLNDDGYTDYSSEQMQTHLFFSDVELSASDESSWATLMPNWAPGIKTDAGGKYIIMFRCSPLDQWSHSSYNLQSVVLTCVVWRPIKNGGKRILFRFSEANQAFYEWVAAAQAATEWRRAADSYKRGSY